VKIDRLLFGTRTIATPGVDGIFQHTATPPSRFYDYIRQDELEDAGAILLIRFLTIAERTRESGAKYLRLRACPGRMTKTSHIAGSDSLAYLDKMQRVKRW